MAYFTFVLGIKKKLSVAILKSGYDPLPRKLLAKMNYQNELRSN
jgi:hypothetical protein